MLAREITDGHFLVSQKMDLKDVVLEALAKKNSVPREHFTVHNVDLSPGCADGDNNMGSLSKARVSYCIDGESKERRENFVVKAFPEAEYMVNVLKQVRE